jgi:hypothetical protein
MYFSSPPEGTPGNNVYAVPPRTIEDPVVRLEAAVTMVNANMLRRV